VTLLAFRSRPREAGHIALISFSRNLLNSLSRRSIWLARYLRSIFSVIDSSS
jgi:hypothetical protein